MRNLSVFDQLTATKVIPWVQELTVRVLQPLDLNQPDLLSVQPDASCNFATSFIDSVSKSKSDCDTLLLEVSIFDVGHKREISICNFEDLMSLLHDYV